MLQEGLRSGSFDLDLAERAEVEDRGGSAGAPNQSGRSQP